VTLKLLALIVPLGLDSFAVAAALGMSGVSGRAGVRVSALFGLFEAVMPLVGFAVGYPVGHAIGTAGDYFAIAVLLALGVSMAREPADEQARADPLVHLRGFRALLLGLSISVDELVIGFTLGLLRGPVLLVAVLVGVQAIVFSQIGLRLGARLGEHVREGAERLAGAVLIALALGLLVERLLA
jgi:manganese efflux pump family protein